MTKRLYLLSTTVALLSTPLPLLAQGTVQDYVRANGLREKYTGLALNVVDGPRWIEQTNRFYYRRTVKGGTRMDARRRHDAGKEAGIRSREARGGDCHGDDA